MVIAAILAFAVGLLTGLTVHVPLTTGAFVVGLLLGVCIGFGIGSSPPSGSDWPPEP